MSYLPELIDIRSKKEILNKFAGLNMTPAIKDAEFCKMLNMTSDQYPALSPRAPRHFVRRISKPNGLFMHDRLAWVDGTSFYYDGHIAGSVSDCKKTLIGMGAYIVIFPDKLLFNTKTQTFENMENKTVTQNISYTLTDDTGEGYTYTSSSEAPLSPADGSYWLDTSKTPHVLKQYSQIQQEWAAVDTVCVKISGTGIGLGFNKLDTVSISGMPLDELNGDFSLHACADDYIVITGVISEAGTENGSVTVERKVPDMDFVTESGNRIWGCSSFQHEIYASKQGDAKNWYSYLGIASDSYASTIGTKGDFTGASTHMGYVTFFKEDVIQRVYGSKPANYQINDTYARGVEKGSERSVAMINETLFYKSMNDICCMSGGLPQGISKELGNAARKNAVGGTLGKKYYLSMQEEDGSFGLYVFDSELGFWHKEDDTHVLFFAGSGGELYFSDDKGGLWNINGDTSYDSEEACSEGPVSWYCITGSIGMDSPDSKYVSKLRFRLEADNSSTLKIEASYDGGDFKTVYSLRPGKKRSVTVPIVPRRCDTMRLKISGRGSCRIYSITKSVEPGSDA